MGQKGLKLAFFSIKHDLARSCFQFCHPRSRFWEPKLKTWSRQIMFYVIYPELWKLLIKNENFVIVEQGGGGPFDVSGGPFVVLEILEKNSEFGNFFSKILKIWKFSKFWIKISKVGSKFWRWEGYIFSYFCMEMLIF